MGFCTSEVVNSINFYTESSPIFGVMCYDLQGLCEFIKYTNLDDVINQRPLNTLVWIAVDKHTVQIDHTTKMFILLNNKLVSVYNSDQIGCLLTKNPSILRSIGLYCFNPKNVEEIDLTKCTIEQYLCKCCCKG